MQVQPVAFTGSGIVGYPAVAAGTTFGFTDPVAQEPLRIVGISYTGFTAVTVHNGSDATGDKAVVTNGAGVYSWNYELNCQLGIYLECTGAGSGTVWLA